MATRKDFQPVIVAYAACIIAAVATLYWIHAATVTSEWRPLWAGFAADFVATVVIFIYSRAYKNSSFYDPYWSVIPPILMLYWMWVYPESMENLRTWLVFALVWAWAIRLTANWSIYWPGLHHEDWRYPLVRERAGAFAIPADFLGIHLFPTIQVFLGCLPILVVLQHPDTPLGWLDVLAVVVTGGAIVIEMLADIQLHAFLKTRQPGQLMDQGLWGWSRHPNYFGEISFWVGLMLFGLAVAPSQWWWICAGALAMILMFVFASVPFLDNRSLERRPEYADYMRRVSAIIPLPPKAR
jgi:steroid 5-alpha reductase family enzyme